MLQTALHLLLERLDIGRFAQPASDAGIDQAAVKVAQFLIAERLARQGASADGVATEDEQVSDLTLSSDFSRDDRS
ncbi:hypothetical protein FLM52_11425 [bacterium Scap17]|nr:hypothetical protein [bacterium Scap17]